MERFCQLSWSLARVPEGPLATYLHAYALRLAEQGYAAYSVHLETRLVADFSRWLQRSHISLPELSSQHADQFLRFRARHLRPRFGDAPALKRLMAFLLEQGAISENSRDVSPAEQLANEFAVYLRQERALAATTIAYYVPCAMQLLTEKFGRKDLNLGTLSAIDVIGFVQRQARLQPRRIRIIGTALRAFLRYVRYRGDINIDLAAAVPAVAQWRMTSIPRAIAPDHVRLVLASCDRHTDVGRRDYAILVLLARLGLRAIEVVALTLEDVDWEIGRLRVRGKGGRDCLLPLPADVGEAIADYLQHGRPICGNRSLFLKVHAPLQGFKGSDSVRPIVARAFERAGIDSPRKGTHQFRHGLATQMLKRGASLSEIGEILRHRNPETTAIYAKVDLVALRTLAMPWPGGVR